MADYTISVTNLSPAEQRAYDNVIAKANATIERENAAKAEQDPPGTPEALLTDAAGWIEWTQLRSLPRMIDDEAREDTTSREIIAELKDADPAKRTAALAELRKGR